MEWDRHYMSLALQLARSALGQTSPNPVVGAVLVKNNEIIGFGAHLKAGGPHAEVNALKMAGDEAQGATLYVTLEPCHHHGRTPPCTDAIIAAGIKRVVVATTDPNPIVRGRGVERLKTAGLEVVVGVEQEEAEKLNEVFNYYIVHRRPFVTLKTATTLDGKIATSSGESQWITSEAARRDVHRLRRIHDAILVGINTVLKDDPRLTARLEGGSRQPVRVVLDSSLKIPLEAKVLDTSDAPTWIFTTHQASPIKKEQLERKGAKVFISNEGPTVEIERVLTILGEEGISSLLVEGGSVVNASFLNGGYAHKLVAYLAPKLIGGKNAPGAFGGAGISVLADCVMLKDVQTEWVGQDLKVVGYL